MDWHAWGYLKRNAVVCTPVCLHRAMRQPLGLNHPALRPSTTHLYPYRPSSGQLSPARYGLDFDPLADQPPPPVHVRMHSMPGGQGGSALSPRGQRQAGTEDDALGCAIKPESSRESSTSSCGGTGLSMPQAPASRQALLSAMWRNLEQVKASSHSSLVTKAMQQQRAANLPSRAVGRSTTPLEAPLPYRGALGAMLCVPSGAQRRRQQ